MHTFQQKWNAEDYAKNSSAQLVWGKELVSKLALHGCETVLDIGCGDGKTSAILATAVPNGKVIGIDLSIDMVRFALAQFPSVKYPNLTFLQMNATDISLSEKFDLAFSSATLHWVKDQISVLRGVHKSLKSGGKLLFQMGGRGNANEMFCTIEELLQRPQWSQYFDNFALPYHFYGSQEYEVWLLENGFRPMRIELVPKDMKHSGVDGLKGWLRTTWFPYTDCLPSELRDAFLSEVVSAYSATHSIDALGNFHVKMVRLEVEAYAL